MIHSFALRVAIEVGVTLAAALTIAACCLTRALRGNRPAAKKEANHG